MRRQTATLVALTLLSTIPAFAVAPATAATLGPVDSAERLNFGGDYLQIPSLAVNEDGDAVAVWRQDDGAPTYIWASRSHRGSPWSDAIRLSEYATAYDPQVPQVAAGLDGSFLVTWLTSSSASDFYYTWYHPTTGWDKPLQASISPGHTIAEMLIATDGLGNAFALVLEFVAASGNLSALRYTAGSGWGSMAALETSTDFIFPTEYALVADAGGNATAVWVQSENTWPSVLANRYTPGTGWMGAVHLESELAQSHRRPALAGAPTGEAVAAWEYGDGVRSRIASSTYTPGAGWSALATVDQTTGGTNNNAAVSFAGPKAVVVWNRLNGSGYDLNAARGLGASWGEHTNLSFATAGALPHIAGTASSGTAVASWMSAGGFLYAKRYVAGEGWSPAGRLFEADPTFNPGTWTTAADGHGNTAVSWYSPAPVYVTYGLWVRESVPPPVAVTSPAEGSASAEGSVLVTGNSEPEAWVAANGVVAEVDPTGAFSARVPLHAGMNSITVTARDAAGNEARAWRNVTYDDPVPALLASLAEAEARADALEASVASANANLSAAVAEVAATEAALASLEQDANATAADLVAARGNLSAAHDRVNGLESQVSTLSAQLIATQSRVAALERPGAQAPAADNGPALIALVLAAVAVALSAVSLVRGRRTRIHEPSAQAQGAQPAKGADQDKGPPPPP